MSKRREIIDLRSDTVTKPSAAMRRVIGEAEVGDDVYGEDPVVNHLQERVADLLGKEAALFVPSGCMANQIAIKIHTQPGDEVLVGQGAHNWLFESGAAPVISGVQVSRLPGDGRFDAAAVREAFKADNHHVPPTSMVSVENTHNMGGGVVWQADAVRHVIAAARELGLAVHLDGARLWNAAVKTGRAERDLAAGFDTVAVCLSKGLGAPVGSLIAGSRDLMHRAHRVRKMLGGQMRQIGILAAAGLYAIEHNRNRLSQDHDNAEFLAREVDRIPGLSVDLSRVQTNIVMADMVEVSGGGAVGDARQLQARARERGLLFNALSAARIRLMTHLDVDRSDCARAIDILGALLTETADSSTRASEG
ncbi:MAG: low-specificity L-threonine aldolase [Proteobacteria bacterium]|nr:low-specificity L-threonine aldolase [Pseudomonadota bacterium]